MASNPPLSARYPHLRDLGTNVNYQPDPKDRIARAPAAYPTGYATGLEGRRGSASSLPVAPRSPSAGSRFSSRANSPQADRAHRKNPAAVTDFTQEIAEMFLQREKTMPRDPNYMATQTEVNEKMRTILVDWLVDVHIKFKLHEETLFLAVDLVDRFLAVQRVSRQKLQLVGITCMLLAAKYEEIWPPEVKECIHITANTYSREEVLEMERQVTAALLFKLTTPTPFAMLARLLEVTDADSLTRHAAFFFLEHAVLDYKHLQFLPSQLANAAMYLARVMLRESDAWNYTLQYYSKSRVDDFAKCAKNLLDFTTLTTHSKYQAIRRKYSSTKYGEVARHSLPTDLPIVL